MKPLTLHPHEIRQLLREGSVLVVRPLAGIIDPRLTRLQIIDGVLHAELTRELADELGVSRELGHETLPTDSVWWHKFVSGGGEGRFVESPFGPIGSRLWCRETWVELLHTSPSTDEPMLCEGDKLIEHAHKIPGSDRWGYNGRVIAYRATSNVEFCDGDGFTGEEANRADMPRWRSPQTMPQEFSRLTVTPTSIGVKRVQDVTDSESEAAGFKPTFKTEHLAGGCRVEETIFAWEYFAKHFDTVNPKHPWESNPWVWAATLERVGT